MFEFDTIAAISTALGEGAIGIVRLSGEKAIDIANTLFKEKDLTKVPSHTIHYGHIQHPTSLQQIDEVMVSVMKAPKTFTKEDVVEINCHGGIVVVNKVLQTVLEQGARLAEPGEFTKRAFLNGRIDLSQAEAVMDLIRAKTDTSMSVALKQVDGHLSSLIRQLRQDILNTLAQVEVNIDYPEYDEVEEMTLALLKEKSIDVKEKLEYLLQTAQQGKILRDGLQTAIIGRPNVGKSSLLNRLLREDKAIVTDIAGTTRDTIEEYVNVRGVPLKLVDTAGIRDTDDVVEQIGVKRSKKAILDADFIILILNQSEQLSDEDKSLLEMTKGMKRLILLNKIDLPSQLYMEELLPYTDMDNVIPLSVLNNQGIDKLEEKIAEWFFAGQVNDKDATYVSNVRHITLIQQAIEKLKDVLQAIDLEVPVDLIQIDFTRAWELLGEITGDTVQDELLTELFSQFCLGK
ncbi:tRNA uridine-5-carboxymethylaminomethyl(34) synthesis GTPase MnmE [Carnobacteriaceae bacterium zg-84]|uniref:tRNA uridine-5-carboxymethylaminomethyl(34) synthesis GTPase MnmE n=1 Tax=Granulicatella sp. zg-84 TaxID=2678503 RepID=UPI0013C1C313|nr:tRNA uridine-5-carboxymethylaminomethyl(34) synthesis GTPase MnmE [Granulicatella sp. zg-84]NEW65427.1 tRNA uridine-5-carboxymethylaminomethyl(34) synthesis GTPase MnmE [Granulicatella sp. zg-84]QMI85223.1 tRNA uridine-5-carboxymethylaminomethyl(34) synthesis GTPase MnmE [Carnobacteriaceae bacterium zg-84]